MFTVIASGPNREELDPQHLVYQDETVPMVVWRVENEDGQGPYNAHYEGGKRVPFLSVAHAGDAYPSWKQDFFDHEFIPGEALAGFMTRHDALVWFRGFGKALVENGYRLVELKARKVWLGKSGRQIVFIPFDSDELD